MVVAEVTTVAPGVAASEVEEVLEALAAEEEAAEVPEEDSRKEEE